MILFQAIQLSQTFPFQTIQFSISAQFTTIWSYQVLTLLARVDLGVMERRWDTPFPKAAVLQKPDHQTV